jgi:hypothetical protein
MLMSMAIVVVMSVKKNNTGMIRTEQIHTSGDIVSRLNSRSTSVVAPLVLTGLSSHSAFNNLCNLENVFEYLTNKRTGNGDNSSRMGR